MSEEAVFEQKLIAVRNVISNTILAVIGTVVCATASSALVLGMAVTATAIGAYRLQRALSGLLTSKTAISKIEVQAKPDIEGTLNASLPGQKEVSHAIAQMLTVNGFSADQPISFLLLGPSAADKKEIALSLATVLFESEYDLKAYGMDEFRKYTIAELVNILSFEARHTPDCVTLFENLEGRDKDMAAVLSSIIRGATLEDSMGTKASFAGSTTIVTSAIGAQYFQDKNLTADEAKRKALADLRNPAVSGLSSEFLAGFTGVLCLNPPAPVAPEMANTVLADASLQAEFETAATIAAKQAQKTAAIRNDSKPLA